MIRVSKATGAVMQSSTNKVKENALGLCGHFEERQVGTERYNLFTKCAKSKTATIVLRGGAEQYIAETERSLNDAVQVVRRSRANPSVVAGGGAIDMEVSRVVREHSKKVSGKTQLVLSA